MSFVRSLGEITSLYMVKRALVGGEERSETNNIRRHRSNLIYIIKTLILLCFIDIRVTCFRASVSVKCFLKSDKVFGLAFFRLATSGSSSHLIPQSLPNTAPNPQGNWIRIWSWPAFSASLLFRSLALAPLLLASVGNSEHELWGAGKSLTSSDAPWSEPAQRFLCVWRNDALKSMRKQVYRGGGAGGTC